MHDVKTMFWLVIKAYIKDDKDKIECSNQIDALIDLLASDYKVKIPKPYAQNFMK
jgi:hypothetical protein